MSFSDESFATLKCSNIDNTKVLLRYDTVLTKIYFDRSKNFSNYQNVSNF